jgi:antitoxin YefM
MTGKRCDAVLISKKGWRSIQETTYHLNISGRRKFIREGLAAPLEQCTGKIDW